MSLKSGVSAAEAPLLLMSGINNNFHKWRRISAERCIEKYGQVATVMKTDKIFVVPQVTPEDYTPEGEHEMSAAEISSLKTDAMKARLKLVRELKLQYPQFYASMIQLLSPESRDLVERHADFAANDLIGDPNVLWDLIKSTHLTNTTGGGEMSTLFNKVTMRKDFDLNCIQGKTSIIEFKDKFTNSWKTLLANGEAEKTEPELAMMFLARLDMSRYGIMYTEMQNDANKGFAFPQSVTDAYNIAATRKEYRGVTAVNGNLTGVFAYADQHVKRVPAAPAASAPMKGTTAEAKPDTSSQVAAPAKKWKETRRCRHCNKVGHLKFQCPDNPNTTVQVVIAADIQDSSCDAYDDFGTLVATFHDAGEHHVLLFSATDVLLDNQGGKSIFRDKYLLHNVCALSKPYSLAGIDGSTETGLKVDTCGAFRDFGKLGNSIGCSNKASANVLSMADCVDNGYDIEYLTVHDHFKVTADSTCYIFHRKFYEDGTKSKHYVADMANYPSGGQVLVQTVDENLHGFSKREIEGAKAARDFQVSLLGHFSTHSVIDILNSGVLNCPVTTQDVLRAERIYGAPIAALKGKTKRMSSTISKATLTPRVTQQQQILHVDLFYVKSIAFILGVLTPLNYVLTSHLQDKSEATVYKALTAFISKAKSRNFDIQIITTDGEGAIKALIPGLQSRGIVVAPAGPGAHVPVAERYIQTIKGHVRCYEHSLAMVMTKILLIFCVLFCSSHLNLKIPTSSGLKVSPLEQFSGRKLCMKTDLRFGFGDYFQATVTMTDNTVSRPGPRDA